MDKSNLKQGEYYGYRDENGNWVTGQNGPRPMTAEEDALVSKWEEIYKPYDDMGPYSYLLNPKFWKATLNDFLFAICLRSNPN